MCIEKLFPNVERVAIEEVLNKYNIELPDSFQFSNVNIIIGSNGAGKTRFLRALKEVYSINGKHDILYGYFPALSDSKVLLDEENAELPECTLYDSLYMSDVSFDDFFREIELHNEEFIPQLLVYHSQRQRDISEKTLGIVQESFFALTGKELVNRKKQIFVKGVKGTLEQLSDELNRMSPGELMLFYMSIFLAIQQNGKNNKVIILDEPESHLHPKALLTFIDILTKNCEFQQIWIATHSLFLIPEFQFENIIFMDNSVVQKRNSSVYASIVNALLGENNIKVKEFFSSLWQWQYCEFIAECFTNPTVISEVNPQDEQVQLFIQYLKENRPIRVLDYGGGSGRLGLSIEEAQIGKSGNIEYEIFDKEKYPNGNRFKVYTDLGKIHKKYHCVVMMNFLHETDPKTWKTLFRQVESLMEENGCLFFVEVEVLTQGELPDEAGYFVLGEEELGILFRRKNLTKIELLSKQKSVCIVIPRIALNYICDRSVHDAISCLEARTLSEIRNIYGMQKEKKLRQKDKFARRYAFLLQQYINAKMFLEKEKTLTEPQFQKIIESRKKNIKIEECKIIFEKIWLEAGRRIARDVYYLFYELVGEYQSVGRASSAKTDELWKAILSLEESHAKKELIAILLATLALMGDQNARKRLINNGYIRYLPKSLGTMD